MHKVRHIEEEVFKLKLANDYTYFSLNTFILFIRLKINLQIMLLGVHHLKQII
jgi:hypothetical protein